ncbi:RHS repeat-associated core domain-containing protein [Kribbella sandramycini]
MRVLNFGLSAVLAAGLLVGMPSPASSATSKRPAAPEEKVVAHTDAPLAQVKPPTNPAGGEARPFTTWPAAGQSELALTGARRTGLAKAGGLPVSVTAKADTESVRITVADQTAARKAGVAGVLLSVAPTKGAAGAATVAVEYKSFQDALGGGFGPRAQLVQLPACALTTPTVPACQVQTRLRSRNDSKTQTVVADAPLAAKSGTVLAVVAAESGANGTFTARSLAPSGSWSVSGNSGSFNWSYPIAVPPVGNGEASGPAIALTYSSGSVDGRTAATNAQPSWIGQGWDYTPGFIERIFRSCASIEGLPDERKTGDQCWAGDIVTMQLGGESMPLVYEKDKGWHGETENGTRIQLIGAGDRGANGEYWEVTKTDGVKYYFGRNKGTGHTNQELTNSAWKTRVYGAKSGDRCYDPVLAKSACDQIYRWNLDFVEDPLGNTEAYYYKPESNYYGAHKETTGYEYTRGGTLQRIDYGLRNVNGSIYGQKPTGQVVFGLSERCTPTDDFKCNPEDFKVENSSRWPDVPIDQECKKDAVCNNHSPTYWSTKRLSTITTQYDAGSGPVKVDTYDLAQTFPSIGDPQLRLDKVQRTGHKDGKSLSLPPVEFTSQLYANRVGQDNNSKMPHWRLTDIATDTGSIVHVRYTGADCTETDVPTDLPNNTRRCYPVNWDLGYHNPEPVKDYFHKYLVAKVEVQERNAIAPTQITEYKYLGTPAWHFDDNELVEAKHRTYGQFRGYGQVEVRSGDPQNTHAVDGSKDKYTLTRTSYFRGMGKAFENSLKESVADPNQFSGQVHEVQTFNGDTAELVSTELTDLKVERTTATRNRGADLAPLTADIVVTSRSRSQTPTATGQVRKTSVAYRYDDLGRPVATTRSGDGTDTMCESVQYADNTTSWIRDRVAQTTTSKAECPATGGPPAPIVGATQNLYDSSTSLGALPGAGLVTSAKTATANVAGSLTFETTGRTGYDARGRVTSTVDAGGRTTRTSYGPVDAPLVSTVTTTNPKNQVAVTQREPSRGAVVASTDATGRRTEAAYDALGRLVSVWLPGRSKSDAYPSISYSYRQTVDQPLAVTTKTAVDNGHQLSQITKVELYDGLGQLRQVQNDDLSDPAGVQRRIVKDVFRDSHGWEVLSNNRYVTNGKPEEKLIAVSGESVDDRTLTTYDGSGRNIKAVAYKGTTATKETTTIHGGDRTTIVPPEGGVPSTTVVDVWGRSTALMTYSAAPAVTKTKFGTAVAGDDAQTTTYQHNALGQLASMKDGTGNTWSYTYDFMGRQTGSTDPDSGGLTKTYNLAGEVLTSTDAKNQVLSYTYDELGRKTAEYKGTNQTAANRTAMWTYDTADNGVGKIASTTRFTPKGAYRIGVGRYDGQGNAVEQTIALPTTETNFPSTYDSQMSYTSTGLLRSVTKPAIGGLPSETLTMEYDQYGQPKTTRGYNEYVSDTVYTPYGETSQLALGVGDSSSWLTYDRDRQTRQVTQTNLSAQQAFAQVDDLKYTYDPAGNLKRLVNTQGDPNNNAPVRTQCFGYDDLNRLSEAWTATDNCAAAPTKTAVGGPAPYWTTWTFEPTGLRQKQVKHALGSQTVDTVTTYANPASGAGKVQPHALAGTTTTGPAGTSTASYSYDLNGSTTSRDLPGGKQTLAWNLDSTLASITTPAGTTSYVYDGDKNQLMRHEPDKTTLYLPGEELEYDTKTRSLTGTRYYAHNGINVAVRTGNAALNYLQADQHGTNQVALKRTESGFAATRRELDPYGNLLSNQGSWPDKHGFLDKPHNEATGLTDIGARKYDPATGRFLSADPILDPETPQQWAAYTYANNNPTTLSDPSGLLAIPCMIDGPCGGGGGGGGNLNPGGSAPPPPKASDLGPGRPGRIDYGGNWSLVVDATGTAFLNGIFELPWSPLAADVIIPQLKATHGDIHAELGDDWNIEQSWNAMLVYCRDPDNCSPQVDRFVRLETLRVQFLSGALDDAFAGGAGAGRGSAMRKATGTRTLANREVSDRLDSVTCSFTGETQVVLADGRTKPIGEIKDGDLVLATDPDSGATVAAEAELVPAHDDTVVDLVTKDGARITTTANHPFYSQAGRQWKRADELSAADTLRTPSGKSVRITGLRHTTQRVATVYNLSVKGVHTYYVMIGQDAALVHNMCPRRAGWNPPPTGPRATTFNEGPLPEHVTDVVNYRIANNGAAPAGLGGGGPFANDGRENGMFLRSHDAAGNAITYREGYVLGRPKPGQRGTHERLVMGNDGSYYYTNSHYATFWEVRAGGLVQRRRPQHHHSAAGCRRRPVRLRRHRAA